MPDLDQGAWFANYRIEGVAGRGGMGMVYRATDPALDRTVALKLIAPELARSPGFRRRFTTESRVAASIDHPNVVPIYAAGEHDGNLFLAMRFVEGADLRAEIEAEGPLPLDLVSRIASQVGSALDVAHDDGLVHRDVKPANILLTPREHVYLTDFGLSKRLHPEGDETETGQFFGTLNYVSPEQIRGEGVDQRADIYALGCVLFNALAGQVPFPVTGREAKLWAHVSEQPPRLSSIRDGTPSALDAALARAMAKDPADRFSSAGELATAVEEASGRAAPRRTASARGGHAGLDAQQRRALLTKAAIAPFNLGLLAAIMIAGAALGLMPLVVVAALAVYSVAVILTYRDEDVRREVVEG